MLKKVLLGGGVLVGLSVLRSVVLRPSGIIQALQSRYPHIEAHTLELCLDLYEYVEDFIVKAQAGQVFMYFELLGRLGTSLADNYQAEQYHWSLSKVLNIIDKFPYPLHINDVVTDITSQLRESAKDLCYNIRQDVALIEA